MAGLFDFFDGALARLPPESHAFGAFLDSVVDRYSDVVVLLGIPSSTTGPGTGSARADDAGTWSER